MVGPTENLGPLLDLPGELSSLSGLFGQHVDTGMTLDGPASALMARQLSLCADTARTHEKIMAEQKAYIDELLEAARRARTLQ